MDSITWIGVKEVLRPERLGTEELYYNIALGFYGSMEREAFEGGNSLRLRNFEDSTHFYTLSRIWL
jgi:hypothetical protein